MIGDASAGKYVNMADCIAGNQKLKNHCRAIALTGVPITTVEERSGEFVILKRRFYE